ncbi:MAG: DinB family protein [candidate division Zixibacteria bacterium]|nr:DinB family protein [candidate division Zixibacteria bacterium]MBU1471651.1 DinB family protein [candidate division Zixibacteria bacterium]MBU2626297.1 DinB family protein [candidate division Zixibacteria bacterium]
MLTKIDHFKERWQNVSESTGKVLAALTDSSLEQKVADDHRTIGRIAWHIIQTIPEMANKTGLSVTGPRESDPVPESVAEIKKTYDNVAAALMSEITSKWTDATLEQEDELYGMVWKRGQTVNGLIEHEIHHRGQMTVLMRQAGLKVPGVYGPSLEEWDQFGMKAPKI